MPQPSSPELARDGRSERAERTREAVVNAMLDLIEEGDLRPTAPRIAERAGVALRSVFHHFQDMEALFLAAARRQMERHLEDVPLVPGDGPLSRRIDAFVTARAATLEAISAVRRSAVLSEPFSPVIARHLSWIRRRGRREIERVFAAELAARRGADRRELLEALTAVASWSTWEALRAHQSLAPASARRVMMRLVAALLQEE